MKKPPLCIKLPPFKVEHVIATLSQVQGWQIIESRIPNTWSVTEGEGETVLIIDSGHCQHNDVGDNAIEGANFVKGEAIRDLNGHQTHCTGIICAKNNETGMVGVAPKSKVLSVKALNRYGNGTAQSLHNALQYAVKQRPSVVSMSLGSRTEIPGIHDLIKELYDLNIPIICAAGNAGKSGVEYPALYPETISVGAYDVNGKVANFSAIGEAVDFSAPGVDIYSTWLNGEYSVLSGTSMATPFISGVVALLLAKHKKQEAETGMNDCKTVDQVREHLTKYATDKGTIGHDNYWGYGVVDVEKLILENGVV